MRITITLFLFSCLVIMCIYGGCKMEGKEFLISVLLPVEEDGLGYHLQIDQAGRVELTAQSNWEIIESEAIGVYHTEIESTSALDLRDSLKTLAKEAPASWWTISSWYSYGFRSSKRRWKD